MIAKEGFCSWCSPERGKAWPKSMNHAECSQLEKMIFHTGCRECLKAYCLQLAVLANHQNGRDTHVRGIKIFAPQQDAVQPLHQDIGFSTVHFSQYATLR